MSPAYPNGNFTMKLDRNPLHTLGSSYTLSFPKSKDAIALQEKKMMDFNCWISKIFT